MASKKPDNEPWEFVEDLEDKLRHLATIRRRAGWTTRRAAELLGVNHSQVVRLENGSWRKSKHIQNFIRMIRLIDYMQLELMATNPSDPPTPSPDSTPPAGGPTADPA